ncbi:MAG: hypothetical protein JWN70_3210 [Planctomycetaceae bacterium]|nr:hypothetical protein [Planctomycetaceae bacterium]
MSLKEPAASAVLLTSLTGLPRLIVAFGQHRSILTDVLKNPILPDWRLDHVHFCKLQFFQPAADRSRPYVQVTPYKSTPRERFDESTDPI